MLKSLDPLFDLEGGIFLAPDMKNAHLKEVKMGTIFKDETLYNSGVFLYQHGSLLIEEWTRAVEESGEKFWSDQHVLSRIIYEQKAAVCPLNEDYTGGCPKGSTCMRLSFTGWEVGARSISENMVESQMSLRLFPKFE